MNDVVIAYRDFSEHDLSIGKDKDFENYIKEFYDGDFYIDSKIIEKSGKQFLRILAIAGKY